LSQHRYIKRSWVTFSNYFARMFILQKIGSHHKDRAKENPKSLDNNLFSFVYSKRTFDCTIFFGQRPMWQDCVEFPSVIQCKVEELHGYSSLSEPNRHVSGSDCATLVDRVFRVRMENHNDRSWRIITITLGRTLSIGKSLTVPLLKQVVLLNLFLNVSSLFFTSVEPVLQEE
jgi:hypothetical protein